MTSTEDAAAALLAGPRGRHLCWTLIDPGGDPRWQRLQCAACDGDLTGLARDLAACVALTDLGAIAATTGPLALMPALADTVATAMYWQQPDPADQALADPALREALLPLARAVLDAPAAHWWREPIAAGSQQYVEWLDEHDFSPAWTGAAAELAAWRSGTAEYERSRDLPLDPAANFSGRWWSTPGHARLVSTSRGLPGLGAVRLVLVEDGLGWQRARCWPVALPPAARVYEVRGPAGWAELAGRYPLDVSKSRRQAWWRVTGLAARWLIPDFAAVAADYDAVHVSVLGYLTAAGRALPVGDAHTLLAGWDPGLTYWLTDVVAPAGPPAEWLLPECGADWLPAATR